MGCRVRATFVVAGGYSGIGLETVRVLAANGVEVIVSVRSPVKAAENLKEMQGDLKTVNVDPAISPRFAVSAR